MTATNSGAARAPGNFDVSEDDVGAFLDLLAPEGASEKKKLPEEDNTVVKQTAEDTHTQTEEDLEVAEAAARAEKAKQPAEEEDDGEQGEEEEKAPAEEEGKEADEGAFYKIKVGDEEHQVPVKDLARLYGQEQALTKKSMEVAETRKRVDGELAKTAAATNALLERANKRWEPFSKIDFVLAAKDLSAEDYTNLRQAAQAAWEDVQYLQNGLNATLQAAADRQAASLAEQAQEALKVLAGPIDQGGVEGWNEGLYEQIRAFGIDAGLKPEVVNNLVDPAAIRLLNDARLYRLGKEKVVTKKINKSPTKVIKTKTAVGAQPADANKAAKAMKKLRTSGETDDAADAFMARWAHRDAELTD